MTSRIGALGALAPSRLRTPGPRAFLWSDLIALALASQAGAALNLALDQAATRGWAILAVAGALGFVAFLRTKGHYRVRQALADQIRPLIQGAVTAILLISTAQLALGETGLDIGAIAAWLCAPVLILAGRFAVREALKARGLWFQPVVLIAPRAAAAEGRALIAGNDGHGLKVAHTLDLAAFDGLCDAELGARLDALKGETVFLTPDAAGQDAASRIAGRLSARGAEFYYRPALGRIPTEKIDLLDAPPADGLVIRVSDSLARPLAQAFKRAFDVVISALALALLAPALLPIAAMIRRDGGPALFRQPRVGRAGSVFQCLKFRTMSVDAETRLQALLAEDPEARAQWDAYQKLDDDPRITPVGAVLRRFSLDELPQLINVLKGEMSLIGPRPMLLEQRTLYGVSLDAYERMRPGLTGLWQVNGRNATTFEERARLDDWYARNWSLWRDGVILLRTVRELVAAGGR
ncbi:MAG: exopolysaccharide biosynthesis polyprenyl glycosylphosphotransferase [Oceanicaulis sp.]